MKIVVTGANGFTGQHAAQYLASKGFQVYAISRGQARLANHNQIHYHTCELTNVSSVDEIIHQIMPDWIIHIAAMSKPDECNNDRDNCLLHNVQATIHLGEAAIKYRARFIYFSTDFIFGENGPHGEDDLVGPLNFYGESKLQAENWVKQNIPHAVIVRPVFIYGPELPGSRPSFIQWVQKQLLQEKSIKVVNDQKRTPTYVFDICQGLETIIIGNQEGVFHLAGAEIITPYEMAVEVANCLSLNAELIEAVDSNSFPEPVIRAKQSGLKINKAREVLNYKPHSFAEGVRKSFLADQLINK
jgi:dTDP-4-dehydrorhamnose reductase